MKKDMFQIDVLRTLLQKSLLSEADKHYVEDIIQKLETSDMDATARLVYGGVKLLLYQDKGAQIKIARRFATKKIDLFKENLRRFTDKELHTIFRACHLIQLTDGCSVACPWCYLNAQPYVNYSLSYDSIHRFITKFARFLPQPTRFYWASDPLDWSDGEKTYLDIIADFYTATGNTKSIVTTTSLPVGTEITFLRLIQWFDAHLPFKKTTSFAGGKQQYVKDNVIKGLFYHQPRSYDIHSLFDYYIKNVFYNKQVHHVLKISETNANRTRLQAVFAIMRFMGVSQSCLSWIEVETRDIKGSDMIRKSGRAYTWEKRDFVRDSVSMACWDSTILFPQKIGAMEMCGVTSGSERGLEFWFIEPGSMVIPKALAITHDTFDTPTAIKKQYLLPYLTLSTYVEGVLLQRWTHRSLRRDIQAYGLLLTKTIPMMEFIAKQTHKQLPDFAPWKEMHKQYMQRKRISESLFQIEKDEMTVQIVRSFITRIEQKFR